jgi:hypothetical protein
MSRGKYSPATPRKNSDARMKLDAVEQFDRNAYGEVPSPYQAGVDQYDEKIHFGDYDEWGYDSYGYSAWLEDGTFVGLGQGVDRLGYTEDDYITMRDDEWEDVCWSIDPAVFKLPCPGITLRKTPKAILSQLEGEIQHILNRAEDEIKKAKDIGYHTELFHQQGRQSAANELLKVVVRLQKEQNG